MKKLILGCVVMLSACDDIPVIGGDGGVTTTREFMVIGNSMTFEQCRASGGLIIRDSNTSMVACDPSIKGEPQPVDEFNNPASNPTG